MPAFKNDYDIVEDKNSRLRRKPKIELKGEDYQLANQKRAKLINLLRDIERNYTTAKSHMRQFRLNVVGTGAKLHINIDEPQAKEAVDWFNEVYAKNCDARDDTPLNEICMNILTSVKREGDVVVAVDEFCDNDGKLFFWEADQLCEVEKNDWQRQTAWKNLSQSDGVVYDKLGRIKAYIVTPKRSSGAQKLKDVTVLPRGTAKLLKAPWRLTQRRGTPDMAAGAAHYLDGYEMLSAELQSGKLASKMAGKVTKKNATEDLLLSNNIDPEDLLSTTTTAGESPTVGTATNDNYERFENLTGGYLEYLEDGDDFEIMDFNRPNVNMKDFIEAVNINNGASLGLARVYSTMTANTSYTAFRGEMLLSWAQFYVDQKWLERRFLDWLARKAINWAVENKQITGVPKGWERKISFEFPTMPIIDPLKLENSIAKALKNGRTDFKKLLGPNWKTILQGYAEQIKMIKELDLPLEVLETKSGAVQGTMEKVKNIFRRKQ